MKKDICLKHTEVNGAEKSFFWKTNPRCSDSKLYAKNAFNFHRSNNKENRTNNAFV